MSIIGKLHEISLYGLISAIIALANGKITFETLKHAAFHPESFINAFVCYLFWASVLFIPIAIIGAFSTKYADGGEGLTFGSDNIVVIIFSHIAEELLGLIMTPFWFLKDVFTRSFNGAKVIDYALYTVELIFIAIGFFAIL
jgi:hypothetical protein